MQRLTITYPEDGAVTVGHPGVWTCLSCRAALHSSVIQHQDNCPEMGGWQVGQLREKIKNQARQIRDMQEVLERKNRELDALHMVWCDGGCPGGVHRWNDLIVTEDLVATAERNTRRLRRWYGAVKFRLGLSSPTADKWIEHYARRAAAKTDLAVSTATIQNRNPEA